MPSIKQEIIYKNLMDKGESASSSDCNFRCPCSFDSSPVDAFQQHRKLGATELNCSALGLRPDESSAFQSLGKQAQTIAIPPEELYDIASASAEQEHVSGEGLLLKHSLHLSTEAIEATAHVRHPGSNPDLRSGGELDHLRRLSNTARTRESSAPLSTLIIARPGTQYGSSPNSMAESRAVALRLRSSAHSWLRSSQEAARSRSRSVHRAQMLAAT